MKHYLLVLIFICGTFSGIFAQESEKKTQFSPEFTLSLNQTTVGFKHDRLGFGVGIYNAFFNQKRCNLIVGLEYNFNSQLRKNNTLEYKSNTTSIKNYFGIPVLFRVNMGKKVKFFIESGVFIDPLIFEKAKLRKENIASGETIIYNGKVKLYKPDFGISGGVGLRIPINKHEILIKGDYKWGMRKLIDFSTKTPTQNPGFSIYNQYVRLTIGFKANFASDNKFQIIKRQHDIE